jgi:hypothetical protein
VVSRPVKALTFRFLIYDFIRLLSPSRGIFLVVIPFYSSVIVQVSFFLKTHSSTMFHTRSISYNSGETVTFGR